MQLNLAIFASSHFSCTCPTSFASKRRDQLEELDGLCGSQSTAYVLHYTAGYANVAREVFPEAAGTETSRRPLMKNWESGWRSPVTRARSWHGFARSAPVFRRVQFIYRGSYCPPPTAPGCALSLSFVRSFFDSLLQGRAGELKPGRIFGKLSISFPAVHPLSLAKVHTYFV